MDKPNAISKILSSNDAGATGGHQSGILIPKGGGVLDFFPDLGCKEKNPRVILHFEDQSGKDWRLSFIYYNNKFFDENGTRNEYRLTGMTSFFKQNGLKPGDTVTLIHRIDDTYAIEYTRETGLPVRTMVAADGVEKKRLTLGGDWKVINY